MRHLKRNKKFGRPRKQRQALRVSLAQALIDKEKILTTRAKAKDLQPWIEQLITKGKKNNLSAQRLLTAWLNVKTARKIKETIAPRYQNRAGGYTRIIKHPSRLSDGAEMAIIELIPSKNE